MVILPIKRITSVLNFSTEHHILPYQAPCDIFCLNFKTAVVLYKCISFISFKIKQMYRPPNHFCVNYGLQALLNLLTIWSDTGFIKPAIVLIKSCLLMSFNSTSMPSTHDLPLHHKAYTFSDSLIKVPDWASLLVPSSPVQ